MSKELTARQIQAAHRLAVDHLKDEAIADEAGVSRRALAKWKQIPEFQALIKEHRKKLSEQIEELGICSAANIALRANEDRKRLLAIRDARAQAARERFAEWPERVKEALKELVLQTMETAEEGEGHEPIKLPEADELIERLCELIPFQDRPAPGEEEGWIVRMCKDGWWKFEVDNATAAEIRNQELHAMKATGRWVERSEVKGDALGLLREFLNGDASGA